MKHRWGTVTVKRSKTPYVEVSFNRGDETAMRMIARWFGLTYNEFLKLVSNKGI